jgi:hypothetical protein
MSSLVVQGRQDYDWRLPSLRSTRSTRKQAERLQAQLAIEEERRIIQHVRVRTVTEVGVAAMQGTSTVTQVAEAEAAAVPGERHRVDAIADATAAALLKIVMETGQ